MAKRRSNQNTFNGPNFPDIGNDEPEEIEAKVYKQADIDAMKADYEAKLKAANDQAELLKMVAHRPAPQQVVVTPPKVDTFVPKELPDPVLDKDGYARTMRENLIGEMEWRRRQEQAEMSEVQTARNQAAQLWADFGHAYPQHGTQDNYKRVEYVATQLVERARARGIDPNNYMFNAQDKFFADVAAEMDVLFGKPKSADENDNGAGDDDDNDDDNRSGGIFGGSSQGNKLSDGPAQEKLGSVTQDIMEWQRKHGFTR